MKALEVKDLTFSYDKSKKEPTLDKVSFDVEKGEYVSIIGHNGSGKSTLSKLLIGLLEANSGSIKVFDEELNDKTIYNIRNHIGIVFQNPDNQFIGATVADDIAFGLENKCVPSTEMEEIVVKCAKEVGMDLFLDKEPSALSGGQKQRVAIASTLAMGRDIIIMDEATAMLDPRGKEEIRNLVTHLKEVNPNLTILSITHDLEEAAISSKVIVLNKGQILFSDKPEVIFKNADALKRIGLDIPFFNKMKLLLKDNGFDVDYTKNEEELLEALCQ